MLNTRRLPFACLFLFVATILPICAEAQVLNNQVNALLANNCAGLGTGGPPNPNLTGLGSNLAALCQTPITAGAASTGGGAASFQGSAASILNRVLFGRLEENKNEGVDAATQSSSLLFNPFGMAGMTSLRSLSVTSPFYAATSTNGGSNASFATSSQSRWNGLGFFASGVVEALNRNISTFQ